MNVNICVSISQQQLIEPQSLFENNAKLQSLRESLIEVWAMHANTATKYVTPILLHQLRAHYTRMRLFDSSRLACTRSPTKR